MSEFRGTERFAVKRQIGQGGMGVVYEALDRERDAVVAIKTLREMNAQALYRFKNEFRALADLEHPNLVRLEELIEDQGQWFFTMEFVEGVDFLSYVRLQGVRVPRFESAPPTIRDANGLDETERVFPPNALAGDAAAAARLDYDETRLRAALGELALGLSALHAAGKVHRDIKPSNVLVTPEGRVVLLDFGLVAELAEDADGEEHVVVGTAPYMAPEQAASRQVGPAADWYSMGVMMYEALTSRLPFVGTMQEICMDKQKHEPPPPRAHRPDVPRDLDGLCSELLRFEPAERPASVDILKRLGVDQARFTQIISSSSHFSQTPPFVGRYGELRAIREAYLSTRRGNAVATVVYGESGIGKSSLIRKFTEGIQREVAGAVVLAGRCYEREAVPYKAFDGVVDALSRFMRQLPDVDAYTILPKHAALLPRVFPVLGRVEAIAQATRAVRRNDQPHVLRSRVFQSLRELLTLIAERHALIVVIDDLQWADTDSLILLGEIMRPPEAPPLLLLVSSRTEPRAGDGMDTGREALPGDVRSIPLGPLDRRSAPELARLLLIRSQARGDINPAEIAVEARGHPLFIDELVRHAAARGWSRGKTVRLDEVIRDRVQDLPAPAKHLLELVAVCGAPVRQEIIAHAARMAPADFSRWVALLRVANLVRSQGERGSDLIEVFHNHVRDGVYAHLGEETRRDRHGRVAIALETAAEARERPELLLRHLEAAGEAGKAAEYAEEAAARASVGLAFERAAELYKTTLRLGKPEQPRLRELQFALGKALVDAGRGNEAADVFLQATIGADRATRLECQTRAAEQLLVSGHIERGLEVMRTALGEFGVKLPPSSRRALAALAWQRFRLRTRGLGWTARQRDEIPEGQLQRLDVFRAAAIGLGLVDPVRGAYFQARELSLALRTGEKARIGIALCNEAVFRASQGSTGLQRARRMLETARHISAEGGSSHLDAQVEASEGVFLYFQGRFGESAERLAVAETMFRDVPGATWERNAVRLFRLFGLRQFGALDQLRTLTDEYLRDAVRRGDRYMEASLRRSCNIARLAVDEPREAERHLDAVVWSNPENEFDLPSWWELEARVDLALYRDDAVARLEDFRDRFAAFDRSMLVRVQIVRAMCRWLRARLALSLAERGLDPRNRINDAARIARQLHREEVGYAAVYGALVDAAVVVQQAGKHAAAKVLHTAAELARARRMRIFAAVAQRQRGALMGGEEGRDEVARADRELREAGVANPAKMARLLAPGLAAKS